MDLNNRRTGIDATKPRALGLLGHSGYGDLIKQYEVSLTNVKWHSVTWPYTMTTPYWSDFYRILSGFHRTFETGVACRQGTLIPLDTWSRPFGTCICSTCWDQSFPNLSLFYRTMLFEYPSVLSRFCFLTLLKVQLLQSACTSVPSHIWLKYRCMWRKTPINSNLDLGQWHYLQSTPLSIICRRFCQQAF